MKKFLIVLCLIGGMFCKIGYAQFMKEVLPEGNYVSASDIAKEKRKKEQKEVMEDENVSVENDEKKEEILQDKTPEAEEPVWRSRKEEREAETEDLGAVVQGRGCRASLRCDRCSVRRLDGCPSL